MSTQPEIDPTALPPGTRLGHYVVVSPLGAGGMGTVYVVERDGRKLAAKLSKQKVSALSPEDREVAEQRIRREISLLFAVSHPNLQHIYAADWYPDMSGYLYIVTDLIEGEPLYEWQRKTRPSLRVLLELFLELADGLQTLHRARIVHRDLKSANIIVDATGRPVIIDFGVARQHHSYTLTAMNSLVGTVDHLSPENCRFYLESSSDNPQKYEHRPTDDLYALGVILYWCLTGRPPFMPQNDDEFVFLRDIVAKTPPSPRSLSPAIPQALEAITLKLLEKDPTKRFQSGEELAQAIEAALETDDASWDAPYEPSSKPPSERPTPNARRRSKARGSKEAPVPMPSKEEQAPPGGTHPAEAGEGAEPRSGASPDSSRDVGFVPVEPSPSAPAGGRGEAVNDVLPTGVREHAAALEARSLRPPRKRVLLVAGGLTALLALVAVALFSPSEERAQKPQSLLADFEHKRQEDLSVTSQVSSPAAAPTTGAPPPIAPPGAGGSPAEKPPSASLSPGAAEPSGPSAGAPAAKSPESKVARRPSGVRAEPRVATAQPLPELAAPPPEPQLPQRSLLRSTAMRGTPQASAGSASGTAIGVARGQMLAVKLLVPVDPGAPGSVTATLTQDVVIDGHVALPKGATVVGASQGGGSGRVAISWDTINVPGRGAISFEGEAFGSDKQPGLALRSRGGASAATDAQQAALGTAEKLAGRVLGDGAAADVGRGVMEAGSSTARRAIEHGGAAELLPAPAGTPLYVFVQKPF